MLLTIGTYTHALNEAAVSFSKRPLLAGYGLAYAYEETWRISGFLQAPDPVTLVAAQAALEEAYSINGQTVTLTLDPIAPGAVARTLQGVTAVGNTVVQAGVDFPEDGSRDAEATTFRRYSITVVGRYPIVGTNVTLAFTERLTITGTGGPRNVFLQPLTNLPQQQQTATNTVYRMTQRGQAIGLYTWPTPPAPLFPLAEHQDQRVIDPGQPKRIGAGLSIAYVEFPIDWSYVHESVSSLAATPTLWTGP